jgi:hypothetical protein
LSVSGQEKRLTICYYERNADKETETIMTDTNGNGKDITAEKPTLFSLGEIVVTPGILDLFDIEGTVSWKLAVLPYLKRHKTGDWGDLEQCDKDENDFSVKNNLRIFSAYHIENDTKIWIITEYDRSATTILLPSEY